MRPDPHRYVPEAVEVNEVDAGKRVLDLSAEAGGPEEASRTTSRKIAHADAIVSVDTGDFQRQLVISVRRRRVNLDLDARCH